jgi:hypothetical protein
LGKHPHFLVFFTPRSHDGRIRICYFRARLRAMRQFFTICTDGPPCTLFFVSFVSLSIG